MRAWRTKNDFRVEVPKTGFLFCRTFWDVAGPTFFGTCSTNKNRLVRCCQQKQGFCMRHARILEPLSCECERGEHKLIKRPEAPYSSHTFLNFWIKCVPRFRIVFVIRLAHCCRQKPGFSVCHARMFVEAVGRMRAWRRSKRKTARSAAPFPGFFDFSKSKQTVRYFWQFYVLFAATLALGRQRLQNASVARAKTRFLWTAPHKIIYASDPKPDDKKDLS